MGWDSVVLKMFWCHRAPAGNPHVSSAGELNKLTDLAQLDFGESYFGSPFTPICGDWWLFVPPRENLMQHHIG